jgi:hypothetical protein
MLPFMKPKSVAGLIIQKRSADTGLSAPESPEPEQDQGLSSAAEDLIRAVHAKDAQGVAAAIRAAFELLDSEPHEEGPHTNEPTEGQE